MWRSSAQQLRVELIKFNRLFFVSMGSTAHESQQLAVELVRTAEERSRKEGTWSFHKLMGDFFLEEHSASEPIGKMICKLRSEGVRDADIKGWWNQHDLERYAMIVMDEWFRSVFFFKEQDRLGDVDKASISLRRTFVMFGVSEKPEWAPEDQLLPHELRGRVNDYIAQVTASHDSLKDRASGFSTINAYVRSEIRAGNL